MTDLYVAYNFALSNNRGFGFGWAVLRNQPTPKTCQDIQVLVTLLQSQPKNTDSSITPLYWHELEK